MRKLVLTLLRYCGVFRLWRYIRRKNIVVLSLHSVMDPEISSQWIPLRSQYSRKRLDSAIGELKKYYTFISLDEAVEMLSGVKPVKSNCMVLTLDDGYRNSVVHALPILRKHAVPFVIYVAVANVRDRKPFWFDRLDYALQKSDIDGQSFLINGRQIKVDATSREALTESYRQIRAAAKEDGRSDHDMTVELDALAEKLEAKSGLRLSDVFEDDPWSCVMNWQEVATAAKDPLITIGSHTIDHVRLGEVEEEKARFELTESKKIIEEMCGLECAHFCYPSGSYNEKTPGYVADAGYRSAVTSDDGINDSSTDLMTIERIHLPYTDDLLSTLYVASGLSDTLASIRNR